MAGRAPQLLLAAVVALSCCRSAAAPAAAAAEQPGAAPAFAASATLSSSISIDASSQISRVSPLMVGSAVEFLNHQVYGFGLYAQMVYGESFEEPPVGSSPGPPAPAPGPGPAPPSPPGPPCAVSALTNDSAVLNPYCQHNKAVRTNGLCNIKCPSGAIRPDHCTSTGWEKTIKQLCGSSSSSSTPEEPDGAAVPPYPLPGCANPDNRSLSGMWSLWTEGSSGNLTAGSGTTLVRGDAFNGEYFQRLHSAASSDATAFGV